MTTLDVLRAARDLISDPVRWIQGHAAIDALGFIYTRGDAPNAVMWCAVGALEHVLGSASYLRLELAISALDELLLPTGMTLDKFNDTHTHAEVLALFNAAIARLEAEAHP